MKKFFILLFALVANAGTLLADSSIIFSESFSSSKGNFTISNKQIPSNISYVWQWKSANYGMVASAFASGTAYASESWLISPTISLEDCTSATLSFDHALNKGASTNLRVKVSADSGSTWSDLSISQWPAGTNWTFINATASLDIYVGNSVQIAFVYNSTTSVCPQWEVKNFKISGTVNENGGTGTSYSHAKIGKLYYNLDTINLTAEVISENSEYPYWSTNLTSVKIPSSVTYNNKTYSVTSVGEYSFAGCTSLTSVTIPSSVTSIGNYAFGECSGLTSVTILSSVTSIGNYAFAGCSGLTSVTIPSSVTSIGDDAFYYCTGLTSIEIPNSVTSIGNQAFLGCSGLTSVTIGNSVTSIGDGAFSGCSGLTSVVWNAKNYSNCDYHHTPFYCDGYVSNSYFDPNRRFDLRSQITSFTFGNEVEHIPACLCNGMSNLTSVTIPNSVTSIGRYAFELCTGLTSVTIPNSVTSIGESAFYGCSGLTSVIWNAKNYADFASNNTPFYANYYDEERYQYIQFDLRPQITSFTFGNEVEHIPACLCNGMSNLTSVTIPNSVTSIGDDAFAACTGLTSIEIPNSVTSIGESAFYGCSGLTSPVFNAHVFAFMPTSYSGAYTIPDGIESIAGGAFQNCIGMTSLVIPNSVTSIGRHAFFDCTGLTSITIPGSVTCIGTYAFERCENLTSVTIGKGCDSIGDYAFRKCKNIKTITLPSTLTYIGEYAFDSESILDVYDYATTPQDMSVTNYYSGYGLTLLRGVLASARLHVPQQSIDLYKEAYYWCYFGTITPLETSEPEALNPVFNGEGSSLNSSDRKILRNGQIFILRGEKVYTLTGQEVR